MHVGKNRCADVIWHHSDTNAALLVERPKQGRDWGMSWERCGRGKKELMYTISYIAPLQTMNTLVRLTELCRKD